MITEEKLFLKKTQTNFTFLKYSLLRDLKLKHKTY